MRLARPDASDADLERALRRARPWSFVEGLPDGWGTPIGEEGREPSGGRRRRVALARALLADAAILVLDEPTAHLDPATARDLVRDVVAAAGDASVLLITHRPRGSSTSPRSSGSPGSDYVETFTARAMTRSASETADCTVMASLAHGRERRAASTAPAVGHRPARLAARRSRRRPPAERGSPPQPPRIRAFWAANSSSVRTP